MELSQTDLTRLRELSQVAKVCMDTPGTSDGAFWRLYGDWVGAVTPDVVLALLDMAAAVEPRTQQRRGGHE